jgi:transposase-like protein
METIAENMSKFTMAEEDALRIFRGIRWANSVYCPKCHSFHIHTKGARKNSIRYRCAKCKNNFSDFTDSPFEYSKIPFGKILCILVHINTKSISQLAKELELHRNTVGRYHKRIREYLLENHENI